jgi:hypothetical protein
MSSESDPNDDELTRTLGGGGGQDVPGGQNSLGTGDLWGHLRLIRKIGEGSYGDVYRAHDTWLDHPVALKLLKPDVAHGSASARILQEARKLARVQHPNVVSIHGADKHNGQVGFWMDLVDGSTLSQLVANGRLSAGEATHFGQEVCRALTAVHQAKLVHRDVKAQNVMRAADGGRIILMDFGAGEFMDDRSGSSRRQGTPVYLAPEVLTGGNATVRSDIYAVGVLLFHMVTGEFPLRAGSVPALIEAHRRGDRRHLRDVRTDLPDAFIAIVERALDAEPSRRYASAGDLLAALATDIATADLLAVDGDARGERTRLQRLAPLAAAIVATVAVMPLLGLFASRWFEIVLQVEPEFRAGPTDYFVAGAQAFLPFLLAWAFGAAVLGLLAALRSLVPARLAMLVRSRRGWHIEPTALATGIFVVGAGSLVVLTWAFLDLYGAMEAMHDPSSTVPHAVFLSPATRAMDRAHGIWSVALSFLLGLAAWQWFPRIERRLTDAATVRTMKWATVAVAFLTVALAVVPRRLFWERFEIVQYEQREAFVIASNAQELLLYSPHEPGGKRWRIRQNAPGLTRSGTTKRLFDR